MTGFVDVQVETLKELLAILKRSYGIWTHVNSQIEIRVSVPHLPEELS